MSYWTQDEWQGNETDNWNEGYWAYEDKQHGNPKHGMIGKKSAMMNTDISKEKERKARKEKERRVMDLKTKEKDKVMGLENQTM